MDGPISVIKSLGKKDERAKSDGRKPGRPFDPGKKKAILAAALIVLIEDGYDGTVDRIVELAGGSKQTIYRIFRTKEQLLDMAFSRLVEDIVQPPLYLDTAQEISQILCQVGAWLLEVFDGGKFQTTLRIALSANGKHAELRERLALAGPHACFPYLTECLRHQHLTGQLDVPDPMLAAEHFYGLVVGHIQWQWLLGQKVSITDPEKCRRVNAAVRAFLAAYACQSAPAISGQ